MTVPITNMDYFVGRQGAAETHRVPIDGHNGGAVEVTIDFGPALDGKDPLIESRDVSFNGEKWLPSDGSEGEFDGIYHPGDVQVTVSTSYVAERVAELSRE